MAERRILKNFESRVATAFKHSILGYYLNTMF